MRRVLIDECINPRLVPVLRRALPHDSVETVRDLGWAAQKDHVLLSEMKGHVDVFQRDGKADARIVPGDTGGLALGQGSLETERGLEAQRRAGGGGFYAPSLAGAMAGYLRNGREGLERALEQFPVLSDYSKDRFSETILDA